MYTESEKAIYAVNVGGVERRFDPLAVRRRLYLHCGGRDRFEAIRGEYEQDGDELASLRAEAELLEAVHAAFGLRPVGTVKAADEIGDADALELLYDWMDWMGKPPSADATLPTSQPSTDSCRS